MRTEGRLFPGDTVKGWVTDLLTVREYAATGSEGTCILDVGKVVDVVFIDAVREMIMSMGWMVGPEFGRDLLGRENDIATAVSAPAAEAQHQHYMQQQLHLQHLQQQQQQQQQEHSQQQQQQQQQIHFFQHQNHPNNNNGFTVGFGMPAANLQQTSTAFSFFPMTAGRGQPSSQNGSGPFY